MNDAAPKPAIAKMRRDLRRATTVHRSHSPADRFAWLSAAPQVERIHWPFSKRGTLVLLVILTCLVGVGLLMAFPISRANGPAWIVYAMHDNVVLPIRGRIFERYEPVPQIVVAIVVLAAACAFFARNAGVAIYNRAVRLWVSQTFLRRLLAIWLGRWHRDGHLWATLEAEHRQDTESWLLDRTSAQAKHAIEMGRFMIGLDWRGNEYPRHDASLASIAVRHAVVLELNPSNTKSNIPMILNRSGGVLCASLVPLFEDDLDHNTAEAALEAAWEFARRRPEGFGDLARDAVVWGAWLASLVLGDAAFARRYQARMAQLAFERDLRPNGLAASDVLKFEPSLWLLGGVAAARAAQPGLGLGSDALGAIRDALRDRGHHESR